MTCGAAMQQTSKSRAVIGAVYRADEAAAVKRLLPRAELPRDGELRAEALARRLVETVRRHRRDAGGLDAFLVEFGLDTASSKGTECIE